MGFTMSDLSPATLGYVQTLASTAVALGLNDCSDSRYSLTVNSVTDDGVCRRVATTEK